jgi:hypothetical protein
MIFATGEIKEGFFDNGVFKFEGNESHIKSYMMKNKIKSSGNYEEDDRQNS